MYNICIPKALSEIWAFGEMKTFFGSLCDACPQVRACVWVCVYVMCVSVSEILF